MLFSAALEHFRWSFFLTRFGLVRWPNPVWLSALASINVVVLRQTHLVQRWVTICGWVNHLEM